MAMTRIRTQQARPGRGDEGASPELEVVRKELLEIAQELRAWVDEGELMTARLDATVAKIGSRAELALVADELHKLSGGDNGPPGSDAALIAQEIAMAGGSRDQAQERLREIFGDVNVDALLDAVYLRPS